MELFIALLVVVAIIFATDDLETLAARSMDEKTNEDWLKWYEEQEERK
jgi:hypothetical protein